MKHEGTAYFLTFPDIRKHQEIIMLCPHVSLIIEFSHLVSVSMYFTHRKLTNFCRVSYSVLLLSAILCWIHYNAVDPAYLDLG